MTRRRKWFIAFGLGVIAAFVAGTSCAHPSKVARPPAAGAPHVKVKTYNLNYGLAGEPVTLAAIGAGDPDIVLLQETSEHWEPYIRAAYSAQYPHVTFHHCCGAGGLAVLSKAPFEEKEYLKGPEGSWFPALRVVAQSPVGELQILVVHLHPPATNDGNFVKGYFSTDEIREQEMRAFFERIEPGVATLIVGDFNEPDGAAVRFLQDKGMRTAVPEFAPKAKTWRWPLPVGEFSSRLDHVFYDGTLEPLSAEVQQEGNSDHLPILAVFERKPTGPAALDFEPQRSPGSLSYSP